MSKSTAKSGYTAEMGPAFEEAVRISLESAMPIVSVYSNLITLERKYFICRLTVEITDSHKEYTNYANIMQSERINTHARRSVQIHTKNHQIEGFFDWSDCLFKFYNIQNDTEKIALEPEKSAEFLDYIFLVKPVDIPKGDFEVELYPKGNAEMCSFSSNSNQDFHISYLDLWPHKYPYVPLNEIFQSVDFNAQRKELTIDDGSNSKSNTVPISHKNFNIKVYPRNKEEIDGHWEVLEDFKPFQILSNDKSVNFIYGRETDEYEVKKGSIIMADMKMNMGISDVIEQAKKHIRDILLDYKHKNILYLVILKGTLQNYNNFLDNDWELQNFKNSTQVKVVVMNLTSNDFLSNNLNHVPNIGSVLREIKELKKKIDKIQQEIADLPNKILDALSKRESK